ncbi:MAG: LysM peptidoglycan-binding domain-containing protein [Flavobacteriaceae bacterium]|nr:LysM peptidoglycan-binding domain-containing protein [Flavobacteriaceae bacterium]
MKNIKLLFILFFLTALTACGQQKKYVSYTVKKGETIRSIAKDNDMKVRDLLRLNPDVSRKPDANTVIIIPNKKKKATTTANTYKGKVHTVKRKETLFSIAQKYNVTVDDLKKVNDIIGNNVSIGRELKIPLKKKEVVETPKDEEVVETKFNTHIVEKDDTVFNLTRRFDITEEELFEMNPTLNSKDDLKLGMTIIVGEKSEEIEESLFVDDITSKPLNVVLMLPYKVNSTSDYNMQFKKKSSLLNVVTDFHSGVLVAIDSLRKQGMRINLKVVDTENNVGKITSIINSTDFDEVDVVVGPLFLKNAKIVAKKVGSIPVIAPMYSKNQTSISEGSLIKVAPNKKLVEDKLINYMFDNYSGENIVITGDAGAKSVAKIARVATRLKSHDSISEIKILKPEKGYIKKDRFIEVIDTVKRKNWVVFIGKDNVTTNDVVNNLGVMSKEKAKIQLFSFGNGSHFSNVSNNQLARLQFTYPKEEFVDITDDAVKYFRKKYKKKYHAYPTKHAIKGFDVTYDALLRLSSFDSFNEGAKAGVSQRIGTKFDYRKKLFGSTENKGVFLIQYQEDLNLKVLE